MQMRDVGGEICSPRNISGASQGNIDATEVDGEKHETAPYSLT